MNTNKLVTGTQNNIRSGFILNTYFWLQLTQKAEVGNREAPLVLTPKKH